MHMSGVQADLDINFSCVEHTIIEFFLDHLIKFDNCHGRGGVGQRLHFQSDMKKGSSTGSMLEELSWKTEKPY